jgi:aldose 1-epimerase
MSTEFLPTGRPFALQLGDVRAEIGSVAAVLRSLTVGCVAVTQPTPFDDAPAFCNGIVLSPWPNRVRAGRWLLDGSVQQLDITEPELGGSLHGLLQFTEYALVEKRDASLTLAATISPQHGWPFVLDTWVRYELMPDGLTATHGVTNRSVARAPYATGAHPYLRVGDTPIAELQLTVSASTYFEVDDHLDPIAERSVEGSAYDARTPRRVESLAYDTAFGEVEHLNVENGRGDVAWLTAPDGARTTLWQDTDWRYLQVFTTHLFPSRALPTPSAPIDAIAIEPMTAPPDALNSGLGVIWLEPAQSWHGSWGLRYSGAR